MNKEFINKKGVFQSVQDHQVEEAKVKAKELNDVLFDDYYKGRKILSVTYTEHLSDEMQNALGTKQAVFFELEPPKL